MIVRLAYPLDSVVRNGHHALMTALSASGRVLAALLGAAAITLAGCHSPSLWTAHTVTSATYPPMPATDVIDGPFPVVRVVDGDTIVVEIDGTPTSTPSTHRTATRRNSRQPSSPPPTRPAACGHLRPAPPNPHGHGIGRLQLSEWW